MKKIILLCTTAFLFAVQSHAATIYWGSTATSYFGFTSLGGNATAYLVYLGENGSWSDVDIGKILDGTSKSITQGPKTSGLGRFTDQIDSLDIKTPLNDGKSTFGFIVFYDGKPGDQTDIATWYFTSQVFYYDTKDTDYYVGSPTDKFSWNYTIATTGAGNNLTADIEKQGWQKYVIPEPATAGLALAGLALLFRRKRK